MRKKTLASAKLVIRVKSDKITRKIETVSVFDNRTQEFWLEERIKERGIRWFLDIADLKETLSYISQKSTISRFIKVTLF